MFCIENELSETIYFTEANPGVKSCWSIVDCLFPVILESHVVPILNLSIYYLFTFYKEDFISLY